MLSPILLLSVLLTLAVVFVNGFTDAPNAITSCVATRAFSLPAAVSLAALCNLSGSVIMTRFHAGVAQTVTSLVDLGDRREEALCILCAAMLTVVAWGLLAWVFGIPTSESHALLAALSGAAVARRGMGALCGEAWRKVRLGLLLSTVPAVLLGIFLIFLFSRLLARTDRRRAIPHFVRAERLGALLTAFLHGAQDGQKFLGVLLLACSLACGETLDKAFRSSLPLSLVCGGVMACGTLCGGGRIIKRIGSDLTHLDAVRGTAADLSSAVVLLLCSLCGLPVSTTHAKTCAVMGAGRAHGGRINQRIVLWLAQAWILTFPVCALLGAVFSCLLGRFLG